MILQKSTDIAAKNPTVALVFWFKLARAHVRVWSATGNVYVRVRVYECRPRHCLPPLCNPAHGTAASEHARHSH